MLIRLLAIMLLTAVFGLACGGDSDYQYETPHEHWSNWIDNVDLNDRLLIEHSSGDPFNASAVVKVTNLTTGETLLVNRWSVTNRLLDHSRDKFPNIPWELYENGPGGYYQTPVEGTVINVGCNGISFTTEHNPEELESYGLYDYPREVCENWPYGYVEGGTTE